MSLKGLGDGGVLAVGALVDLDRLVPAVREPCAVLALSHETRRTGPTKALQLGEDVGRIQRIVGRHVAGKNKQGDVRCVGDKGVLVARGAEWVVE